MNKILSLLLALLISTNAYAGETEINRLKSVGFGVSQANEIDSIYIDTTNAQILTSPTVSGNLTFSTAAAKIIPGATSLTFRNNADSASNLVIADNGNLTLRGDVTFSTGPNILSAGTMILGTSTATSLLLRANSLTRWTIDSTAGQLTQDATNGGDIVGGLTDFVIRQSTTDGADNKAVTISSGSVGADTRGASTTWRGNEFGSIAGSAVTTLGDVADSTFRIYLVNDNSSTFRLRSRNGADLDIKVNEEAITVSSGATQTITGIIPAGAVVLGVTARVTTLVTGATSIDIGDAGDTDRYANDIAVAVGTTTSNANYTANPEGTWSAAARDIVLTANGGNFTGGVVRVAAFYRVNIGPQS